MAGVKERSRKREKAQAQEKRSAKRIGELERELLIPGSWPPSNPKAAQARWYLVQELARLKGVKIKEIKKWLEATYPS